MDFVTAFFVLSDYSFGPISLLKINANSALRDVNRQLVLEEREILVNTYLTVKSIVK